MPDIYGRRGSLPFLDQIEKESAEQRAAVIEGRDPDYSVANLDPLAAQRAEQEQADEERARAASTTNLTSIEVDLNDPAAIRKVSEALAQHAEQVENDNAPTSLVPGVADPTIDNSVTPENVNTEIPTVPTGNTTIANNPVVNQENVDGSETQVIPSESIDSSQGTEEVDAKSATEATDFVTRDGKGNSEEESTTPVAEDPHKLVQTPLDSPVHTPTEIDEDKVVNANPGSDEDLDTQQTPNNSVFDLSEDKVDGSNNS